MIDREGYVMANSVVMAARVPAELAEAARAAADLPTTTAVVRYALAVLAGLDPAKHARPLKEGRPYPSREGSETST